MMCSAKGATGGCVILGLVFKWFHLCESSLFDNPLGKFSGSLRCWSQYSHSKGSGFGLWSGAKISQVVCYGIQSVSQFSHSVVSDSLWPHESQHVRPPRTSPAPGVHPNPCPSSPWCHPTISCRPVLLLPSIFPASGSFQMSQLFASGGQSIGVSASSSILPVNTQDWSPLGWTSWISLQSKGLSRVFSNTTVQKHQFFGAQLSL